MLEGRPIHGVIGVHLSVEAQILCLDKIVIEGRYLQDGEEDAILISEDLKEELEVEVDEILRLGGRW